MTTAVETAGKDDFSLRPWASEAKATLALSWPMILTNLAQVALNATDVIIVGWLGAHALAASALGTNLYFALMIFGIGLTGATAPMIARELGRNRHSVRDVRRTVRQGLWAAVAITIPFWIVLWNAEAILLAFHQDPQLAADAGLYMRGLQWALLPFLFYLVLRSFVSALERPMWSVAVGLVGVTFNAVAVWALVFGHLGLPRMGLLGAGIGSTLSATIMFVGMALVVTLDGRFRRYHVFGRFWRPDWRRFRELWRLGLPMAFAICFEVTVFNAAVFLMGLIGASSVAAHAIAIQIASLTFMVPLGFSQAVTVRVGRAYGSGDREAVRRAGWTAFAMTIAFMSCTCAVMILAPGALIGAFIDRTDPVNAEVVGLAIVFLGVAGIFQVFDGAQAVVAGMLRGLHDTRVPMIYAGLGFWGVGLSLSVVLGFWVELHGLGIWIGLATGLGVVAALLLARWLRRGALRLEEGGGRVYAPAH